MYVCIYMHIDMCACEISINEILYYFQNIDLDELTPEGIEQE